MNVLDFNITVIDVVELDHENAYNDEAFVAMDDV